MSASAAQFRAARAMLGLSQEEAAALAGVSKRTVISIEQGQRRPINATATALLRAYMDRGIMFTPGHPETGNGAGVQLFDDDLRSS